MKKLNGGLSMENKSFSKEDLLRLNKRIARWGRAATVIAVLYFVGSFVFGLISIFFLDGDYRSKNELALWFAIIAVLICLIVQMVVRQQRAEKRIDQLEQALAQEQKEPDSRE